MTAKIAKHLSADTGAELRDWVIGLGDEARVESGKFSFKGGRMRVANGTKHVEMATLDDVVAASNFRGGFSAATGSLPSAATVTIRPNDPLVPGQFVLVTTGGTIAGVDGADALSGGDLLFYLGGDAAVAGSWHGISRGLDLTPFVISGSQSLATLPANAATRIAPPASMLTVTGFLLTIGSEVANGCFDEQFSSTGATRGVTLTSLVAKANISCLYTGLTI